MSEIIDFHVHFYPASYLTAIEDAPTTEVHRRKNDDRLVCMWRGGLALTVPQPHPGVGERLEMMDQLGIATQVLSLASPSVYFLDGQAADDLARSVNEEYADICRAYPGRFRALGAVAMQNIELALSGMVFAVTELKLDGLMLLTNVNGIPLDDPSFERFWEAANELRLLIHIHPTVPAAAHVSDFGLAMGVGFYADTTLALSRLAYSGVFQRYPGIRWVFSHLGGSIAFMLPRVDNYYHQFPDANNRTPRLPSEYIREQIFDTTTTHRPAIECAVQTLGIDRLVFGSDYPHIPSGVKPFLEALKTDEGTMKGLVRDRAAALLAGYDV